MDIASSILLGKNDRQRHRVRQRGIKREKLWRTVMLNVDQKKPQTFSLVENTALRLMCVEFDSRIDFRRRSRGAKSSE